jgi:hypothetical protein
MIIILNNRHIKNEERKTRLCIPIRIQIQKRYGGGDKVGKIVKETGKMVAPRINEAVAAANKAEGQNTPQETTEKSKTKSTEQEPKQKNPTTDIVGVKNKQEIQPVIVTGPFGSIYKIKGTGEGSSPHNPGAESKTDKQQKSEETDKPGQITAGGLKKNPSIGIGFAVEATLKQQSLPDKAFASDVKVSIPSNISTTPPPPTPPPMPSTPKPQVNTTKTNHVSQINELGTLSGDKDHVKPSQIPEFMKSIKAHSGKVFKTAITKDTTPQDIGKTELLSELKNRELIKDDDGKTDVEIILSDNTRHVLGKSTNKVKLTSLGQAYWSKIKEQNKNKTTESTETEPKKINLGELTREKCIIIIPPKSSDDESIIETAKQKHLLVVHTETDEYFVFAILTSKSSEEVINKQQLSPFQKQCEGEVPSTKEKPQRLFATKQFEKLRKIDIQRVKWDTKYVQSLSEDEFDLVKEIHDKNKDKPAIPFENKGITKEEGLKMCQEHDHIIATGQKHPMTLDQIQNQEKAKQKQKAMQQNLKESKTKNPNDI